MAHLSLSSTSQRMVNGVRASDQTILDDVVVDRSNQLLMKFLRCVLASKPSRGIETYFTQNFLQIISKEIHVATTGHLREKSGLTI